MARKKAKTGGAAYIAASTRPEPDAPDSSTEEREAEEDFLELQQSERRSELDEEEEEEEVFDLAQGSSSDSSESARDSDSGSGSDNDSEKSSDEESNSKGSIDATEGANKLKALVDNLPANLRQKVLLGRTNFDSDDDDSDDDDNEDGEDNNQGYGALSGVSNWGKKKSYYTGDTADLEIGQDIEDAIDEEEAALLLQKKRLQSMRESDFIDDNDSNNEDDSDDQDEEVDEGDNMMRSKKSKDKNKTAKRAFMDSLESVALEQNGIDISDISRDKSNMSKRQRLEMLASELPELLGLSQELLSIMRDVYSKSSDLRDFLSGTDYGSSPTEELFLLYLEAKTTLYHSYSNNVLFAMYLRAAGKNLRSHPVMKQILEHQYAIRNMSRADKFYREEFRGLVLFMQSLKDISPEKVNALLSQRRATMGEGSSSEAEEQDSDSEEGRDEMSEKALGVEYWSNGDDDADVLDDDEAFNRLEDGGKKQKQARRAEKVAKNGRASAPASADFGEFEDVDDKLGLNSSRQRTTVPSLKSSLQGFVQAQNKVAKSPHGFDDQLGELGRPKKATAAAQEEDSDDSDKVNKSDEDEQDKKQHVESDQEGLDVLHALLRGVDPSQMAKRERRKVPNESMNGDTDDVPTLSSDDGDEGEYDDINGEDTSNLYEAFAGAKQRYMAKKKLHYTVAPRYGGVEQTIEEGAKRGASYEIMKNKGLTPHRKKANRNPRVKKRQMYAKAVVARKGQVREVITPSSASYGGEATGIKANLSKGRRIKT